MGKAARIARFSQTKASKLQVKQIKKDRVEKALKMQPKLAARAVKNAIEKTEAEAFVQSAAGPTKINKASEDKPKYVTEGMIDYVTLMKSGKNNQDLKKLKLLNTVNN